jgi:hypothetical protein
MATTRRSSTSTALALVFEWANLRHDELLADWTAARQGLPLAPIPPLD